MKNLEITFPTKPLTISTNNWSIKISEGNNLSIASYNNPETSEELKESKQIIFGNKFTVLRDKLKKL